MTQPGVQRCLKNSRQAFLTAVDARAGASGHLDERAHPAAGEGVFERRR
jgi:hypothetical protein